MKFTGGKRRTHLGEWSSAEVEERRTSAGGVRDVRVVLLSSRTKCPKCYVTMRKTRGPRPKPVLNTVAGITRISYSIHDALAGFRLRCFLRTHQPSACCVWYNLRLGIISISKVRVNWVVDALARASGSARLRQTLAVELYSRQPQKSALLGVLLRKGGRAREDARKPDAQLGRIQLPSHFEIGGTQPVDDLTGHDARKSCNKAGVEPCSMLPNGTYLPTDAQDNRSNTLAEGKCVRE